ncbi:MAG: DUF5615 family PIN-like protein [Bryobacteraceae bacterium]
MFTDVALNTSPDAAVCEYAKKNGFVILTADADFFELTTTLGPPPKVLWLRRWDHPTRDAGLWRGEVQYGLLSLKATRNWACLCSTTNSKLFAEAAG